MRHGDFRTMLHTDDYHKFNGYTQEPSVMQALDNWGSATDE